MGAGYFYCTMQRISAAVVLPHMAESYGFSAALVGFLSSLYFYTYGFTQNVWGAISDRVGPVRSCSVGLLLAGVGSIIMVVSHDPFFIGLSRIVTGLGLGSMFTGIYLYAALAFPLEMYPYMVGWVLVIGNLGSVAAVAPLGMLMDKVGYNGLYMILSAWGFSVAGLLWFFKGKSRSRAVYGAMADGGESQGFKQILVGTIGDIVHGVKLLLDYRPIMVVAFLWITVSASMQALQGLWGVSWMAVSSGVSGSTARFWATFISVGLVVGSPFGAKVTYISGSGRTGIAWLMGAVSAAWVFYLIGALMHFSAPVMGVLGFFLGVFTGAAMVYCSSTIKSLVDISHAGLIIGTGNTFIYAAVIICQWGSGAIINEFPASEPGTYMNEGYLIAFGVMTVIVVLSLLSIWTVRSFEKKADAEGAAE